MNRMTQNLPSSANKFMAGRSSVNLDTAKSPRNRMQMWKEPELDGKDKDGDKKEKVQRFKQNVIKNEECEIFEAEDVSDETTESDDEDIDDMDMDDEGEEETFGDEGDPLAAI